MEGNTGIKRKWSSHPPTHPAVLPSLKRAQPHYAAVDDPGLGQDPIKKVLVHTALPLPDCRRPWRTWVDTSSWEDQAFFIRSGLQRYLLGSVAKNN